MKKVTSSGVVKTSRERKVMDKLALTRQKRGEHCCSFQTSVIQRRFTKITFNMTVITSSLKKDWPIINNSSWVYNDNNNRFRFHLLINSKHFFVISVKLLSIQHFLQTFHIKSLPGWEQVVTF